MLVAFFDLSSSLYFAIVRFTGYTYRHRKQNRLNIAIAHTSQTNDSTITHAIHSFGLASSEISVSRLFFMSVVFSSLSCVWTYICLSVAGLLQVCHSHAFTSLLLFASGFSLFVFRLFFHLSLSFTLSVLFLTIYSCWRARTEESKKGASHKGENRFAINNMKL